MARLSEPVPSERALILAAPRGLTRLRRALPVSQRMALGIAASAVGTIFVKRLVELVAEDVYHRARHLPGNLRRRGTNVPATPEDDDLQPMESAPYAEPRSVLWVQVVRMWRIIPVDRERD